MHYTLYKGESNIIDNTCYLEIFNFNIKLLPIENGKKIKIFLGQPLYNINNEFTDDYIFSILEKLKINIYFLTRKKMKFYLKILILLKLIWYLRII